MCCILLIATLLISQCYSYYSRLQRAADKRGARGRVLPDDVTSPPLYEGINWVSILINGAASGQLTNAYDEAVLCGL